MSVTLSAQSIVARDQRLIADALRVRYNPFVVARGEDSLGYAINLTMPDR
jgi:hypothetical protein